MSSIQSKKFNNIITAIFSAYIVFAFVYFAALASVNLYLGKSVTQVDHYAYTSLLTSAQISQDSDKTVVAGQGSIQPLIGTTGRELNFGPINVEILKLKSVFIPAIIQGPCKARAPPFIV
ncbi:MAG: hypothetical protein KC478_13580 [Bacteriovoracaceae bacterium]|nr:hypothetical protein [Bacteriovoracaceae bacterium]